MLKLIKGEFIKLYRYTTFWVLLLLHALLFLLALSIASRASLNINGIEANVLFSNPYAWETVAWMASWFNLILALLYIILTGNEYQFNTYRRQLLDGFSRNQIISAKILMAILFAIYTLVLVVLFGVFATPVLSSTGSVLAGFRYVLVLLVQVLGYLALAFLLISLIRNIALSIVIYLLYFVLIEPFIRLFMSDGMARFMPVKVISNLTPMPDFLGIMARQFNTGNQLKSDTLNSISSIQAESLSLGLNVSVALFYTVVFFVLSYIIFKRRDF